MSHRTGLALALAAVGCANYMKVEVEGRVVDEAGNPVARAEVTTTPWLPVDFGRRERAFVRTDEEGRFSATLARSTGPEQALFASVPGGRGGFVVLPGERASGLTIVLRPLTPVRARVDDSKIPLSPITYSPHVMAVANGALIATSRELGSREVTFLLPPGSYEMHARGMARPHQASFEVKAGEDLDLGTLTLEPWPYQELQGRPAPELHIADARGVPKEFKLSDWRGRRVILFFWNHRMESNRHFLRTLIEYHAKGKTRPDPCEILVVHNSDDVLTVRDLDRALRFKELQLPLPVVIDDNEKSFNAYGLERGPVFRSGPTLVLLDREGNVSRWGLQVYEVMRQEW